MKTLDLKHASRPLADYAAKLGEDGIILTSRKKPVAALVSVKGADAEGLALGMNPAFLRLIHRARSEVRRGRVASLQQVKRQLGEQTAAAKKTSHRPQRKVTRG